MIELIISALLDLGAGLMIVVAGGLAFVIVIGAISLYEHCAEKHEVLVIKIRAIFWSCVAVGVITMLGSLVRA